MPWKVELDFFQSLQKNHGENQNSMAYFYPYFMSGYVFELFMWGTITFFSFVIERCDTVYHSTEPSCSEKRELKGDRDPSEDTGLSMALVEFRWSQREQICLSSNHFTLLYSKYSRNKMQGSYPSGLNCWQQPCCSVKAPKSMTSLYNTEKHLIPLNSCSEEFPS